MDVETVEPLEKDRKSNVKPRRSSRSSTPQKKIEEMKVLQISLKKVCENEFHGSEATTIEETQEDKCEDQQAEPVKENNTNGSSTPAQNETELENVRLTESAENPTENGNGESIGCDMENGEDNPTEESNIEDKEVKEKEASPKKSNQESKLSEAESVEMEPLVVSDEVETELQFNEESSDKESGKGSPIIPRCSTRRSYTRNIPTPKTPKLVEDPDLEKNAVNQTEENVCNLPNDLPKTDLNETKEGSDVTKEGSDVTNVSTAVEVGSDITRVAFAESEDFAVELPPMDESYLRRLRETTLTARRPLRSATLLGRPDSWASDNSIYHTRAYGFKRKGRRSESPEDAKKFRADSPGYMNFFSSPITNFKNRFKSDQRSSTPELLGYKDDRRNLHFNEEVNDVNIQDTGDDEKKHWCSVM